MDVQLLQHHLLKGFPSPTSSVIQLLLLLCPKLTGHNCGSALGFSRFAPLIYLLCLNQYHATLITTAEQEAVPTESLLTGTPPNFYIFQNCFGYFRDFSLQYINKFYNHLSISIRNLAKILKEIMLNIYINLGRIRHLYYIPFECMHL